MVGKATHRKAVPVYEARGFRGAETVGALVALARNALWEEFGREVEPVGLNATQAAVMIALATQARTAADLSRALTHAGAMTRVVDQLEEMALVRRVRLERDYRRQRVELTAEGREMHAQLVQVQIASLNRMLRGESEFFDEDREAVLGELGGLVARVGDDVDGVVAVGVVAPARAAAEHSREMNGLPSACEGYRPGFTLT